MTTVKQIVGAAIPNVDDNVCEHILYARTAYPFKGITAKDIYKAASRYHRASINNKRLCFFCDRLAEKDKDECEDCLEALRIHRDKTK